MEAVGVLAAILGIHECGHFIAARSQGIHVTKFSIGFGPPLLSYQVQAHLLPALLTLFIAWSCLCEASYCGVASPMWAKASPHTSTTVAEVQFLSLLGMLEARLEVRAQEYLAAGLLQDKIFPAMSYTHSFVRAVGSLILHCHARERKWNIR